MDNKFIVSIEEDSDTGDLILPLPEDMLQSLHWVEGDTLEWIDNKNGTWCIQKVEDGGR